MKRTASGVIMLVAAFGSIVQAQKEKIPTQLADKSAVAKPPSPIEPDMKGYGTRGVEGNTLAAMLGSCRRPSAPLSRVQAARCDQLERTLKTQPDGNAKELKGVDH